MIYPDPSPNFRRSKRLVIHLSYLPPEEFTILRVVPDCPHKGEHQRRLCPACWLQELIVQVGMEEAITDDLEFDGRCHAARTVIVGGHMVGERIPSSPDGPEEWNEYFEVLSIDSRPPMRNEL